MSPTEKGNGFVQTAKGPPRASKTARTNTTLVLTMFNEITLSQGWGVGGARVAVLGYQISFRHLPSQCISSSGSSSRLRNGTVPASL